MDANYLKRKPGSLAAYYNFLSTVIWDDVNRRSIDVFIDELELLVHETSTFICTLTRENEPIAVEMYQNYQKFYSNLTASKYFPKFEKDQNMQEIAFLWKKYDDSEYGEEDVQTLSETYTEKEIQDMLTDRSDPVILKLMQYFGEGQASERNRKYDSEEPAEAPKNDDDDDFIDC
uniref:Uncharacterized protein n=1 Tax=Panagrolaimus sp. ES5 TaxID=591445 RepID=A0AC34G063_9BILA